MRTSRFGFIGTRPLRRLSGDRYLLAKSCKLALRARSSGLAVGAKQRTLGRHNEFPIVKNTSTGSEKKTEPLGASVNDTLVGYLQPFTGGINLPFGVSKLEILDDLSNIENTGAWS